MKRLACLLLFLSLSCLLQAQFSPLKNSLTDDLASLREQGWRIPAAGVKAAGDSVEITASGGDRRQILLDVPVEVGRYYCGSVMVRTEEVVPRDNSDRGATLFFGFLDEQRQWINGGEFPRGSTLTSDWRKVAIASTIAIPAQVRYIQVWLCVEGQGKAWFRDFEMTELKLDTTFEVDATINPPVLRSTAPLLKGARDNLRRRILLSQNPAFPPAETFEFISADDSYTPPHALLPGVWHAQNCWTHRRGDLPVQNETFTVSTLPVGYPIKVTRDFPNGVFTPQATLTVSFYPTLPKDAKVNIAIGETQAELLSVDQEKVTFRSAFPLPSGCYTVKVTINDKVSELLYVNKNPASAITFRDDLLMLINGKPFFPIGTYRDPSDELHTFTGIKEAGFNFTHSYYFEHGPRKPEEARAYLRDCVKNGVTACIGIPRTWMQNQKFREIENFCAEVYDEPGLITWYLADEPELWVNRYNFRSTTDAVRSAGAGIPRTLLMCSTNPKSELNQFYGDALSDIYWHDPYPVGRHPIRQMVTALENSRLLASKEQPLWAVIQAFDWRQRAVRDLSPDEVEPKAGKIRCMTHLALATGVQGIVYYWLPKDRYDMRKHSPIQWAEVCSTTKEMNDLMPFLVGRNETLQPQNWPNTIYHWLKRADNGKRALGIINPEDEACAIEVQLPNGKQTVNLQPHGVEVIIF